MQKLTTITLAKIALHPWVIMMAFTVTRYQMPQIKMMNKQFAFTSRHMRKVIKMITITMAILTESA